MSKAVITNAGPLVALAKLNLLHLLKQLYGRVQFPPVSRGNRPKRRAANSNWEE